MKGTLRLVVVCIVVTSMMVSMIGCAAHKPNVNMTNVDTTKYNKDLADCQLYGKRFDANSSQITVMVVGVLLFPIGLILPLATWKALTSEDTKQARQLHGDIDSEEYIDKCMTGKGYKVTPAAKVAKVE